MVPSASVAISRNRQPLMEATDHGLVRSGLALSRPRRSPPDRPSARGRPHGEDRKRRVARGAPTGAARGQGRPLHLHRAADASRARFRAGAAWARLKRAGRRSGTTRRAWRNIGCAVGPRCSPRWGVLSRARIAADTNAPCVLASERASHPDDERRSAKPSYRVISRAYALEKPWSRASATAFSAASRLG